MARRGGAVSIRIPELDDFNRDLARFAGALNSELTPAWVKVGNLLRDRSRAAAPASISPGIQKSLVPSGAGVKVIRRPARAVGVVMGANRRFGWYSAPQFKNSAGRQFEKWVGAGWVPGSDSNKPYYIGDAINNSIDEAMDLLLDEVMDIARKAFPDFGGATIG